MQWGCPQVSGGFGLLKRMGKRGREKSLNVCVLFFSPPVKDEKRHAVKDALTFPLHFSSHLTVFFFSLLSGDAGRNCILIMFC